MKRLQRVRGAIGQSANSGSFTMKTLLAMLNSRLNESPSLEPFYRAKKKYIFLAPNLKLFQALIST